MRRSAMADREYRPRPAQNRRPRRKARPRPDTAAAGALVRRLVTGAVYQTSRLVQRSSFLSGLSERAISRRALAALVSVVVFGLLMAFYAAVFMVVADVTPTEKPEREINTLIVLCGVAGLIVIAFIAKMIAPILTGAQREQPGTRLTASFVIQFAIIATIPIALSAVLASMLFIGIEGWFTDRTGRVLENSSAVANTYIAEHEDEILKNVTVLAENLNGAVDLFRRDAPKFDQFLGAQARLLDLLGAYLITADNVVRASAYELAIKSSVAPLPAAAFAEADKKPLVTLNNKQNQLLALARLEGFKDRPTYLYVARRINERMPALLSESRVALEDYGVAEESRASLTLLYVLTFIGVALFVFLIAMVFALRLSKQIAEPLSDLVEAASMISSGNLDARVRVRPGDDEIATLGHTFNQMTADLGAQRNELIRANAQSDQRRRFMEAVLSGVTAGVIGLDWRGTVTLMNRSASTLLGLRDDQLMGYDIRDVVPALEPLVQAAILSDEPLVQADLDVEVDGVTRNLIVRVTTDSSVDEAKGYVVTFDDVTDLVSAQRMSAWADVARRIAHEIRNPLTPIQLSAERLRRKYRKEVQSQPEIFEQCTDTIIRQVSDIGRMVDEFSSFARMPEAVMRTEDIVELVRQATFLQRVGNPDIEFVPDLPDEPTMVDCDGRQISQAMINILKNAVEAIATRLANEPVKGQKGRIAVQVEVVDGRVDIMVTDNGCGLPKDDRHRLTEPYMTTRVKGTGLGLAIVKKIMEDHGGALKLSDAVREGRPCGAVVRLSFPARRSARNTAATEKELTGALG